MFRILEANVREWKSEEEIKIVEVVKFIEAKNPWKLQFWGSENIKKSFILKIED